MTLRTAGLIAGVLGLILLAVGLFANWIKPAAEASPAAQIDTAVVVVPPEVIALSPDAVLTLSGNGELAAHTARVQDVDAWTSSREWVTLTGIADWHTLSVEVGEPQPAAAPSPSPSASPSASASPAASPAATPAASATPSPAATASATPQAEPTPLGSQDIWRNTAQEAQTYTVIAADVPVGLALVVEALDGASVDSASLTVPRTVDDEWITQVIWWGVVLSIVGLIALIARFVDVRPAQSKGEEWLAQRTAVGAGKEPPKPGSRRHRREAGATVPVAIIPEEVTTGSIPVVETPTTGGVYVVPVTGSPSSLLPSSEASAAEPAAADPVGPEHFTPPVANDEEDHS